MPRLYRRGKKKIYWYAFHGKRVSTGCTDRVAAELAARDIERRFADPSYRPAHEAISLDQAVTNFIEHKEGRGKAPGTVSMYERHGAHLARVLGKGTPLPAIQAPEIDHFVTTRLADGAARTTVGKELSTLRGTLKHARRAGQYPFALEEVMPADFELAYVPVTRHLKEGQVRKLLAKLEPRRRAVVAFIVATGADWVGVEQAERRDLNLTAGTILVRGTKNKRRTRLRPVLSIFRDLLEFAAPYMPFEPWGNVRRDLEVACRRAEVPRITPRDLRRTHGHILKARGIKSDLIGRQLGHADGRMTDLVYSPLDADDLGEIIEARIETGTKPVQVGPQQGVDSATNQQKKGGAVS